MVRIATGIIWRRCVDVVSAALIPSQNGWRDDNGRSERHQDVPISGRERVKIVYDLTELSAEMFQAAIAQLIIERRQEDNAVFSGATLNAVRIVKQLFHRGSLRACDSAAGCALSDYPLYQLISDGAGKARPIWADAPVLQNGGV
jgi:hypothetical protein